MRMKLHEILVNVILVIVTLTIVGAIIAEVTTGKPVRAWVECE